jgi:hypothetical protein
MTRLFSAQCTLLLIAVFSHSTTYADPIVITSGSLTVDGPIAGPSYVLLGITFPPVAQGTEELWGFRVVS